MRKQQTLSAIAALIGLGTLGTGCSSSGGPEKPTAQIQVDAQKNAAAQADLYRQRGSQSGQSGQSAAQSQAAGMAAHYGQPGGQAH